MGYPSLMPSVLRHCQALSSHQPQPPDSTRMEVKGQLISSPTFNAPGQRLPPLPAVPSLPRVSMCLLGMGWSLSLQLLQDVLIVLIVAPSLMQLRCLERLPPR